MNQKETVVTASIPQRGDLCCVVGRVDEKETRDSSAKYLYHWRTLKCRLLIHSLSEIIASPVTGTKGDMYIITTVDLFKTDKVQNKLKDLNIQYSNYMDVERQVYEACLRYTILFNISPAWNEVKSYLLQGRDFLSSSNSPINAVKMEIILTDEETRFLITPGTARLSQLLLKHFSLPSNIVENFMADENGIINFKLLKNEAWIHILPSLKKGKIISILKKIPQQSPFKNYQQLKRHWKNMYGYRLPETEFGLIYYQVYFPWGEPIYYTYPSCCVNATNLVNFSSIKTEDISKQFLQNLTEKVPKICGFELNLKVLPWVSDILQEDSQKENIPTIISQSTQKAKIHNKCMSLKNAHMLQKCKNASTTALTYSGDSTRQFDPTYNRNVNYHGPLTTLLNNSNSNLPHHARKDNLPNFLISKELYTSELYSTSHTNKQSSSKVFIESDKNTKTRALPQLIRSENVKFSMVNQTNEDKDKDKDKDESYSLLRSRSSFDLNDFSKTLDGKDFSRQILDGNSTKITEYKKENNGSDDVTYEKSHYFEDPGKESCNNSTGQSKTKLDLLRDKWRRLSDQKILNSNILTLDSKREGQFNVTSKTEDTGEMQSAMKRIGEVQQNFIENKKLKPTGENEAIDPEI